MKLRTAALAAMVGIGSVFLLRLLATFAPLLTSTEPWARVAIALHLFSAAAMLWFFLSFLGDIAHALRPDLRSATQLAAAGAFVALLLPVQSLLRILHFAPFSSFVASPWIEPLAPLVASLCILVFFAVYRRDLKKEEKAFLQTPTRAAVAAYALFTVLNLVVLALHAISGQLRWLTQMGTWVAWVTLPLVLAGVLALLYFFVGLLRFLDSRD